MLSEERERTRVQNSTLWTGQLPSGKILFTQTLTQTPLSRPLHPSAPLSLSLPQRVLFQHRATFFPSTSLSVSCFVLVLFSRIPEFIEGLIGLSPASLLILKSLFAPTFAASSLGDGGGGLLLSLRGLRACVRKSVCVRRRERERRRKKTSETEYIRACDRRERMALWLWAASALTGRTLMIRNGRLTDWLTDRQTPLTREYCSPRVSPRGLTKQDFRDAGWSEAGQFGDSLALILLSLLFAFDCLSVFVFKLSLNFPAL